MIITQFDIWLSKLNYGWKIEDAPEYLREELRKRLKDKLIEQSKETAKLNLKICKEFEYTEPK